MIELNPTVANVVEYQLPESIRAQENELFVKFLNYYYEWSIQNGQPTDFIQNILSYRDIDLASEEFRDNITSSIVALIPSTSKIDRVLLTKNIVEFLRSKGTFESFQFIMNAVYGEEMEMEWNSDRVLRPSSSEYTRVGSVAVESASEWTDVEGSMLIQYSPTPASASIQSSVSTTVNGRVINWIKLDDKSVNGQFTHDGAVKALRNNINRNWEYVSTYYQVVSLNNQTLTIRASVEENRPYENLIVRQLDSNFRAIVSSFVSRKSSTNYATVILTLRDKTGTFNTNDLYIVAESLEDGVYVKTDYEYGTVSPSIGEVAITSPGSLYVPGERVTFYQGDGVNVDAYVSEVSTGSITSVNVNKKGYGYAVGDTLTVINENASGSGLDIKVSSIDGVGANISVTSALNNLQIIDGGSGYKVNDELEVIGGRLAQGTPPARIIVDSVDSTWQFLGMRLINGGYEYPHYTQLALIDTTTTTKVSGFAASTSIISGVIKSVTLTSTPTITSNTLIISANGYGAAATATLGSGIITGLTITNNGVNYVDPVIEITGDGVGAFILPVMTSDTVTGYTIVDGGTGYTTATVTIKERSGTGAVITPLFKDQTDSSGTISTFTITEAGEYDELPSCHSVGLTSVVGSGYGAVVSLDFKIANTKIEDGGQFYHAAVETISGKGSGAILKAYQDAGVITNVYVVDGGQDYYHGTTVTIPTAATECTLTPIITNGRITSVTVVDGGSGYVPPELDGLVINSGTTADLGLTISGTGKVVNWTKHNGGAEYKDPSELTPLSIDVVSGTGSGAKLIPFLSDAGTITSVSIIDGGELYTIGDTITISGGGSGTNAVITPVIFAGRVTDIIINNGGAGYEYGTSITVVGDGQGAVITPVVETGITSVEILDGGSNYAAGATIDVVDASGTGAEVQVIITDGVITSLTILKKGTGYVNPTLSVLNPGGGSGATITTEAKRYIDSLTITNAGTGYTYADVFILGDGEAANFDLTVEKLGTIDAATIDTSGAGYTSTPIITIIDNSGYGAVSDVKIVNGGGGYTALPVIVLPNKYDEFDALIGTGTKFTCFGEKVGGIKKVSFNNHGSEYHELPKVVFNLNAILTENASFIPGEEVFIQSGSYKEEVLSFDVLLETGDVVLLEDEFKLLLDLPDAAFDVGVYATVRTFDFDRNQIKLVGVSDNFFIVDEANKFIMTENNINVVDQVSGTFDVGDVIVGSRSSSRATIGSLNRASGEAIVGGSGWSEYQFVNEIGMLNKARTVIADNNRYQDRAYVVKTGRALIDYAKTLKDTVHPAGFAMFGDVKTQTFLESNILEEIGYERLTTLLILYAIVLDGFESGWSTMDDLFGEFTKFNFNTIPIDLIKDYIINQTSEYSTGNVQWYNAVPLASSKPSTWTSVNGLQIYENAGLSPNGLETMPRIADTDVLRTSSIQKSFTSVIGNTYTLESFVTKQVNPLTYPEFNLGDVYMRIDTQTGAYLTTSTNNVDVEDMGDYWWIRIGFVATSTTTLASISPARGFITSLNTASNSATGSIRIYGTYIRDVTGLSPYENLIRARNSNYIPAVFRLLATESLVVNIFNLTSGTSWSANVTTYETVENHNLVSGDMVSIAGTDPAEYEGVYTVIDTPTATSFTVDELSDPGTWVSGGQCRIMPL